MGLQHDTIIHCIMGLQMEIKTQVTKKLKCLKCAEMYEFPVGKDDYLAHLYLEHRLVIADVEDIALLEDYLSFWQNEFNTHELEEYCTTMFLDQLPDGSPAKNEKYYLLCDILPKDYELREQLKQQCLAAALERHRFERTDRNFSKECLFCRDVIKGLRSEYLLHLYEKHFLLVGKPENLVYVDELVAKLEANLDQLICLYCEKIFKDRITLKGHMRKKGHKRINPNKKEYDKYFLCNYNKALTTPKIASSHKQKSQHQQQVDQRRNQGKTIDAALSEQEIETASVEFERRFACINNDDKHDLDWSDWADEEQPSLKCLFCVDYFTDYGALKQHILEAHNVDFGASVKDLSFYQRIKVVNFLRRQIFLLRCINCDLQFDDEALLLDHMMQADHCSLGTQKQWDKPEYFFPYLENDGLLCVLDDGPNDTADETVVKIILEDTVAKINRDAERLSLESFGF